MNEIAERVAVLESKEINNTVEHKELLKAVENIDSKLDSLLTTTAKYKGWIGGAMFILSCGWAALTFWFKFKGA